jgi:hypothetical protein
MKTDHPYRAYLLRCWEESTSFSQAEEETWRFLVEEIFGQKRRRGFADFEEVMAFLREQLTAAQESAKSGRECET